jgi:poly-beta-1,6-N-acetyl-D-glucosamine synthase
MSERDDRNGCMVPADNGGDPEDIAKITETSTYILITPAKNEAALIRGALESVTNQTIRPAQWIIVDDGSTDETAAIVEEYAQRFSFIRLVRIQRDQKRNFSSKAFAFKAGVDAISVCDYSFIGNLDADMTLESNYYDTVLQAFRADPELGIAGGKVFTNIGGHLSCHDHTMDSVGGAVQFFRRACYEEIGGYRPLPYGGIDAAAEIVARSEGWKVRKVNMPTFEHRATGASQTGLGRGRYRDGWKFQSLGYGTAFFFCRCLSRLKDRPMVIGSVLAMTGFIAARLRGSEICLSKDAVTFLRAEQHDKLRAMFGRFFQIMPRTRQNRQA